MRTVVARIIISSWWTTGSGVVLGSRVGSIDERSELVTEIESSSSSRVSSRELAEGVRDVGVVVMIHADGKKVVRLSWWGSVLVWTWGW